MGNMHGKIKAVPKRLETQTQRHLKNRQANLNFTNKF